MDYDFGMFSFSNASMRICTLSIALPGSQKDHTTVAKGGIPFGSGEYHRFDRYRRRFFTEVTDYSDHLHSCRVIELEGLAYRIVPSELAGGSLVDHSFILCTIFFKHCPF